MENNQPMCVDAEGTCKISREGVSESDIYLEELSVPPELVKMSNVCLAGVMYHEVEHEKRDCFYPN